MIQGYNRCIKVSDTGICPFCYSGKIIKNGHTKTGKQQYFCKSCDQRFLDYYSYSAYRKETNFQIVQLIKEGLGIRSVARVLNISATTVLKRIQNIAENIRIPVLLFGKTYELDEMRFFIKKKSNPMWLTYAIDKTTKKFVAFYIGRRNNRTLNAVIKTLLNAKTENIYTDKLRNYQYLIPEDIHITQRYGTNGIERKNLNIRTHLRRFGRKTICFSKSMRITQAVLKIYFWL
ncbi:IS1 family transposase [Epilithonimonas hungarica]|uniref:Transposase and inactivated derivatives, IS1 family n=1 Tax=Epilithonimonas hungarica TaxID=454006 RepID=A0A1G7FQ30_9FLAO|nr:IS1 family transposase [Epilithonimonas hungarica]SDE78041.1 Transposase and inactivated derivatives, IS1 family [Epilithonimonas hungarica]